MKAAVKLSEMHTILVKAMPIIEDLATEFPKNGNTAASRIIKLEEGQDELMHLLRDHLLTVRPGGQRTTDPLND